MTQRAQNRLGYISATNIIIVQYQTALSINSTIMPFDSSGTVVEHIIVKRETLTDEKTSYTRECKSRTNHSLPFFTGDANRMELAERVARLVTD